MQLGRLQNKGFLGNGQGPCRFGHGGAGRSSGRFGIGFESFAEGYKVATFSLKAVAIFRVGGFFSCAHVDLSCRNGMLESFLAMRLGETTLVFLAKKKKKLDV